VYDQAKNTGQKKLLHDDEWDTFKNAAVIPLGTSLPTLAMEFGAKKRLNVNIKKMLCYKGVHTLLTTANIRCAYSHYFFANAPYSRPSSLRRRNFPYAAGSRHAQIGEGVDDRGLDVGSGYLPLEGSGVQTVVELLVKRHFSRREACLQTR
jgi:hypothetical protein